MWFCLSLLTHTHTHNMFVCRTYTMLCYNNIISSHWKDQLYSLTGVSKNIKYRSKELLSRHKLTCFEVKKHIKKSRGPVEENASTTSLVLVIQEENSNLRGEIAMLKQEVDALKVKLDIKVEELEINVIDKLILDYKNNRSGTI